MRLVRVTSVEVGFWLGLENTVFGQNEMHESVLRGGLNLAVGG
jgi:hypothetical protein